MAQSLGENIRSIFAVCSNAGFLQARRRPEIGVEQLPYLQLEVGQLHYL
jgi:hypothetical protein